MRNRKQKSQPFKTFETEEDWIAELERIVDMVIEKISARLSELAEARTQSPEVQQDAEHTPNTPTTTVQDNNRTVVTRQMTRQEAEARLKEVHRQAEAFSKKNPSFDMEKEMENKHFCYLVFKLGVSVEDAYFLLHKREILDEKQSPRISENGASKNQGISTKLNPEKFSDDDVAKILERIQDGEQITF